MPIAMVPNRETARGVALKAMTDMYFGENGVPENARLQKFFRERGKIFYQVL